MAYVRCFNNEVMQVEDYTDQVALQATMNGLQSGSFEKEMSKWMLKTFSEFMEEAKQHIIAKALYFIGDASSINEESKRVAFGGPLGPTQGKFERPHPNKGKKSIFDRYTPFTTT